jgi:hypothetical protein
LLLDNVPERNSRICEVTRQHPAGGELSGYGCETGFAAKPNHIPPEVITAA